MIMADKNKTSPKGDSRPQSKDKGKAADDLKQNVAKGKAVGEAGKMSPKGDAKQNVAKGDAGRKPPAGDVSSEPVKKEKVKKEKKSQKERPKSKKKHAKVQIWKHYEVKDGVLSRKGEMCQRCGSGTFIAAYKNRKYCGKCGWAQIKIIAPEAKNDPKK